jgi:hypothetical protein
MVLHALFLLSPDGPAYDAVAAACWLLANVLLFTVAWTWARRLFPEGSPLELIQHTVVLGWGCIVAVALGLGGLGYLTAHALLLGVVALSLLAWAAGHVWRAGPLPGRVPLDRAETAWLGVWAVLFGFWIGHVIARGLCKFPDDWDSLAYHMPLVDHWLQARSLCASACSRWTNPGNNELLALWAVGPFSGDFLMSLTNVPAAILFACSAVAFATGLGLPRSLAHLAGFALVCNFVVLKQLVDAENDVAVAACFFAALSYALRYQEGPRAGTLLLGAISLGLLAGVKYYALGYAALAFAVWILLAARARGPRGSVRVLFCGAAGIILLGGFWYLRNALMTGSPLYPREFFKHPDMLAQIYPAVAQSSFFGNRRPELLELYIEAIQQRTGPCQLAGFLLAPLSLAWLLVATAWYAFRVRDPVQARAHLAMALLLLGTGLLLGATPLAVEDRAGTLNQMYWYYCPVRYGLCFLSTATLAGMLLLRDVLFTRRGPNRDRLDGNLRPWVSRWPIAVYVLACAALAGTIVFQVYWAGRRLRLDWVDHLLMAVVFPLAGLNLRLLQAVWPRVRLRLVVLVAALPAWAWACTLLSATWHQGFVDHYDRMDAFAGLQALEPEASGSQTILVLQDRLYPFFGSRRQHHVYQPVYVPSSDWIMARLETENVRFVVADVDPPLLGMRRFLGFDECLGQHPERFRQVVVSTDHILVVVLQPPQRETGTKWPPN